MRKNSVISKHTLRSQIDKGFKINAALARFSREVFCLDEQSKAILGIISTSGKLNEYEIADQAYKRSHSYTRDVIRYALNHKKNQNNLLNLEFVTARSGKYIKNIKKNERVYSLTLKGFVASLSATPFENSYMVKNYGKFLKHVYHPMPQLDEFALIAIKYNLAMFLFDQGSNGLVFEKNKKFQEKLSVFSYTNPYRFWDTRQYTPDESNQMTQLRNEIQKRYTMMGLLLYRVMDYERYRADANVAFVKFWYDHFEEISNQPDLDWKSLSLFDPLSDRGSLPDFFKEVVPEADRILRDLGIPFECLETEPSLWEQ